MKVLIIGKGGREHALAWKFSQNPFLSKIYVSPGNSGMEDICECVNIGVTDIRSLVSFAKKKHIDLTVVGEETALEKGIVNEFKEAGLKIFGPTKEAALIETSKAFAKNLMKKYRIPTAAYEVFTDFQHAWEYAKQCAYPLVVKADNLAAGKGVIIVKDEDEAKKALNELLIGRLFNCKKVVIEEFLEGTEFSLMAFVNGDKVYPMEIARDYKKAFEGDNGPNTGGMGAYSPVNQIPDKVVSLAVNEIMIPCAKALVREKRSFTGVLYGGLINTKTGPKVIEFNARFGDPETEVVLPRMKNDLYETIDMLLTGKPIKLEWENNHALGVVMASAGYPGFYKTDLKITCSDKIENSVIYSMGIKKEENNLYTNGGRVLCLVGKGFGLEDARKVVYREIKKINCEGLFYRKDIGLK